MATRRSEIQLEVLGLQDLRDLNAALNVHDKRLQALTNSYLAFNAAVSGASGGMKQFITNNNTVNNSLNQIDKSVNTVNNDLRSYDKSVNTVNNSLSNVGNRLTVTTRNVLNMGVAANQSGNMFAGLLGRMLEYRAVSLVFEGVTKAIGGTVQAMQDMERQSARIQRVAQPGQTPNIRGNIAIEVSRTGADIKDVGEAYYQLTTRIKDSATAFSALQTAMNLVVGTEADARQTTRAMLQVYTEFGDQMDKNVGEAENFRRIGELLAGAWKLADAEMIDITNSFKYLAPIAAAAKVPMEQVFGIVTALTAEGQRGRMSGTEAGQFIAQILKNYNSVTKEIENKGAHVKVVFTQEGGIDLQKTIENIVRVANSLPVEQGRAFLLAISGTQNAFRFLGSQGPESMRLMTEAINKARDQMHGLTHDGEDLRRTMTTTAVEWQRAWGGLFTFITNQVNASPVRTWLQGIGDDMERLNRNHAGQVSSDESLRNILEGRGNGPGDRNAYQKQLLEQRSVLSQILQDAAARNLSGVQRFLPNQEGRVGLLPRAGDEIHIGAIPFTLPRQLHIGPFANVPLSRSTHDLDALFNTYQNRPAPERGYLQQFMEFGNTSIPGQTPDVTMDLPRMQAELARINRELGLRGAYRPQGPNYAGPAPVSALGDTRGLTPEQVANAAIITQAAQKYGLDPLALIAVAHYESGLHATNRNPTSTATGLFQILQGTAPGINRADPRANAEFAAKAIAAAGGTGLAGLDAIRLIVDAFERPDAHPQVSRANAIKEIAAAAGFYGKQQSKLGGYHDPKLDAAAEEARRAAEEEQQKKLEVAKSNLRDAESKLEALRKNTDLETATPHQLDVLKGATDNVNMLRTMADNLQIDPRDRQSSALRRKLGLDNAHTDIDDELQKLQEQRKKDLEKKHQDDAKEHAAFLEYYAEQAQTKYGLFSWMTDKRAQEAQQAAEGLASGIDLQKLRDHVTGPMYQLGQNRRDYLKEQADKDKENAQKMQESIEAARSALSEHTQKFADDLIAPFEERMAARQRGLRPNALGGGADDRQRAMLEGNVADIGKLIDVLTKNVPDAADRIDEMRKRLLDANAALLDFGDTLAQKTADEFLKSFTDPYQRKLDDIESSLLPDRAKLQARAAAAEQFYTNLAGAAGILEFAGAPDKAKADLEKADIDRKKAEAAVQQYDITQARERYKSVHGDVQQTVHEALSSFLHGQGDLGTAAQKIGGTIVDAALDSMIKKWTDPLVTTVTAEILAIQENTRSLDALTGTVGGGGAGGGGGSLSGGGASSGMAAAVAAGVAMGFDEIDTSEVGGPVKTAGTGKGGSGSGGPSDLQKGLTAGLAAYSIGAQSAQQGVNAGNLIGSALTGYAIGGPIGAGIGVVADLIGGLFHHADKPTATPQDLNPAYYNAPAGFDVAAYNYSAYGRLPTLQNVGFDVSPANAPVFNVFIDGAKTAARVELGRQTSSLAVSLASTSADPYRPL